MCRKLHKGEELTKNELLDIANNFTLSRHAKERIQQRKHNLDVKSAISNPILAYFNTDGTINIAINKYEYFVVAEKENDSFLIITFKEKSRNNVTIFDKWKLAEIGCKRIA